jgi:hypothetical protein
MEWTCIMWSRLGITRLTVFPPKLYKYKDTVRAYACAWRFIIIHLSVVFSKAGKVENLKRNSSRRHRVGIFAIQNLKSYLFIYGLFNYALSVTQNYSAPNIRMTGERCFGVDGEGSPRGVILFWHRFFLEGLRIRKKPRSQKNLCSSWDWSQASP